MQQVFDIPGIPRMAVTTNNDLIVPVLYSSIRSNTGTAADICAQQSNGPKPEEQWGNPAFNPVHTWVVTQVSPDGQATCGPNPSAAAVAELQKATCESEKERVLRDGGAVSPSICTQTADQLIVVKLVNRQHTAQQCRALGAATSMVDPANPGTLYAVGTGGGITKICTYTAALGQAGFNNASCDSASVGTNGVVEVTRENVGQFNNRFFCGSVFAPTLSAPARPSGWEFFQNWTMSSPPGTVSVPNPMSGELPAACAGSIDFSCRIFSSPQPQRSPEGHDSCKSPMSGGYYNTPNSGLAYTAVVYREDLVNLGATGFWRNSAPPSRSYQSSKRKNGSIAGCAVDSPYCEGVGSVMQCRAAQRGYGIY
jgi:hypothetical protein